MPHTKLKRKMLKTKKSSTPRSSTSGSSQLPDLSTFLDPNTLHNILNNDEFKSNMERVAKQLENVPNTNLNSNQLLETLNTQLESKEFKEIIGSIANELTPQLNNMHNRDYLKDNIFKIVIYNLYSSDSHPIESSQGVLNYLETPQGQELFQTNLNTISESPDVFLQFLHLKLSKPLNNQSL